MTQVKRRASIAVFECQKCKCVFGIPKNKPYPDKCIWDKCDSKDFKELFFFHGALIV